MLVRFDSSETAEVLMYAETAKMLLEALGKPTTARGTFTQAEMLPAAAALREAAKQAARQGGESPDDDEDDAVGDKKKHPPVSFSQRAWPLIDMLERTSQTGEKAWVVWEASADFWFTGGRQPPGMLSPKPVAMPAMTVCSSCAKFSSKSSS